MDGMCDKDYVIVYDGKDAFTLREREREIFYWTVTQKHIGFPSSQFESNNRLHIHLCVVKMHLRYSFVTECHTTSVWKSVWERDRPVSKYPIQEVFSLIPSFSLKEFWTWNVQQLHLLVPHFCIWQTILLFWRQKIKLQDSFLNLDLGMRGPENRTENNCNHRYGDFGEDFFRSRYNKLEVTMITNDDWRNWRGILGNYTAGTCSSVTLSITVQFNSLGPMILLLVIHFINSMGWAGSSLWRI